MKIYFYENGDWATCPQNKEMKCWEVEETSQLFNKIMNSLNSLKPVVENDILIDVVDNVELINKENIQYEIIDLKAILASSDYKITKCYEASMLGEELPYDLASLVKERKELRKKINELEAQL